MNYIVTTETANKRCLKEYDDENETSRIISSELSSYIKHHHHSINCIDFDVNNNNTLMQQNEEKLTLN